MYEKNKLDHEWLPDRDGLWTYKRSTGDERTDGSYYYDPVSGVLRIGSMRAYMPTILAADRAVTAHIRKMTTTITGTVEQIRE